jgi:hypothetical protein
VYTTTPALHAGSYAYGRTRTGRKVFGGHIRSIDWAAVAAWANVCEANGWTIAGMVLEPGDKPDNLRRICRAGGGRFSFSAAQLTFLWEAPAVAADTITIDDLADGDFELSACPAFADRLNTVVPKFISPDNRWEFVQGDAVQDASAVTADGEEKSDEFEVLTADTDQAAQLAAYHLYRTRERPPFTLPLKPRFFEYRPGTALTVNLPEYAPPFTAIIEARAVDFGSMTVQLTLRGETPGKHAICLAKTGSTPTPSPVVSGEDLDGVASVLAQPSGYATQMIRGAGIIPPVGNLSATDAGGTATISVLAQEWDYPDQSTNVTRAAGSVTGLDFETAYYVYFKDATRTDGSVTYLATEDYSVATAGDDETHYIGSITTPADGGADTDGTDWGGWAGGGFVV